VKRYKRALASAGVDAPRLLDLSHTFGSLVAAHTADLVSVKEAMGHTTSPRPSDTRTRGPPAAFVCRVVDD
jgi:hypothetical protein